MLEKFLRLKVEQRRRGAVARQLQALVAQLVEEGHRASLEGLDARVGRIAQEARDQLDGVRRRAGAEDLVPRVRLDLRELVLGIVLVHRLDLLQGGCAEHLDDFDELVHAGLAREERHAEEQLGEHAAHRPDVDAARVVCGAKYQLGGPIVAGANVRHVRLALDQNLGTAKVAELEQVGLGVDEQVLRLDVAMAHAERMNVRERAAELVRVQLHVQQREGLLGFGVVPRHAVHGLRDEVHHEVQVGLVRLLSFRVEIVVKSSHVAVVQHLHDLQLTVLEALILQHLLDGDLLLVLPDDRLVDHTEGAVPNDTLILEDPLRGVVRVLRARGGRLGDLHRVDALVDGG
mmetsp:Transcript_9353/g.23285  ORF Transcript_9353/g.23285 Transcript_9353/m.23285 type:complete len:346 (+) Transcript_9353:247-1284(+)